MAVPEKLLIFGASARAAAFSALRAGLEPWCADLFADADLQGRCSVMRLPAEAYPHRFLELVRSDVHGPWMYTGGLENYPRLVAAMARIRPLWGNSVKALRQSRRPQFVAALMAEAFLPHPAVFGLHQLSEHPGGERWLFKPLAGAGGRGICRARGRASNFYLQEQIDGTPCSAVFLAEPAKGKVHLLGATLQLVGELWLHAAPFHYCGSIGPIAPDGAFEQVGQCLGTGCGLRGLFGVDCVLRDGLPYPVEINPRYTASVEVLEYATGTSALALHRAVFDSSESHLLALRARKKDTIGKAILFARAPLIFPADGPWMATLRHPDDIWDMPAFADIPHPGTPIEAGQPILTFFARTDATESCRAELQRIAAGLDHILFGD